MGVASHSPQRIDKADSGTTIDKYNKICAPKNKWRYF
ncbi:MAG: hypothetical protein ACI9L6_001403 [Flavobacterium sp.]|jgi:hypothetical protein